LYSAVFALENTYTTLLDFGGINSGDAEGAIKRADKGGMVSAKQLRGLVTLLEGVCGGVWGGGSVGADICRVCSALMREA
jgi:hypothetical protein